jgi:Domain of unknown function (DUF1917)
VPKKAVEWKPTQVIDDYWIYASAPDGTDKSEGNSGKWMLFTPRYDHDQVWAKIRTATEAGELVRKFLSKPLDLAGGEAFVGLLRTRSAAVRPVS